jgi:hypothetical protein
MALIQNLFVLHCTTEERKKRQMREKIEKEAKTGGILEFVLAKINRNPAARKAWNELIKAGVDQAEMAENLFRYCGGTTEQLQDGLKVARQFRDSFDDVITQARVTANAIEKMLCDLRSPIGKFPIDDWPVDELPSRPSYGELPAFLRSFAGALAPIGEAFKKSIAQGARVEKDGRVTGGRSESLSILVSLASEVTSRPYALIAPLVAAVQGKTGISLAKLADSLRGAVNRYRKEAWGQPADKA